MKIDPTDSSLYTDSGQFLKTLACPYGKSWDAMNATSQGRRICDTCSRVVHDTSSLSDNDLLSLLEHDPGACLMVSPRQSNCTLIPRAMQGRLRDAEDKLPGS